MRECFIRICLILLLPIPLIYSKATVENGGFNVLIAFSQNVPSEEGIRLIGDIQTSLEDASKILHAAIGLRFSKVTFEIPESWNVSEYNRTIKDSFDSDSVADILIDDKNDTVFGKFPFAQQYGSCGMPGYQIIVPTVFFDSDNNQFPKGISMAREWLKYRYGIFDENGYAGDLLYPKYYTVPGGDANKVHVTDCINSEIEYNFTDSSTNDECPSDEKLIDKLNNNNCKIYVNEENLGNISSSLMYFQESITTMTDICGKDKAHPHNSRSPNKQNILCSGKSIWDVIEKSSDIKHSESEKEYAETEFIFSRKVQPSVVVAWDNSEILKNQGKIILDAIKKLIIDLPDGSKFRAFPFIEKSKNDYSLEILHSNSKRNVFDVLKSDFWRKEEVNLMGPTNKAISILKKAAGNTDEPPGNIILITGTEDTIIVVMLKDLHVCIKSLDESSFAVKKEIESKSPCLEVVRIPKTDEPETIYEKLVLAMEELCPSKVKNKFTEMLKVEYISQSKSMEVSVDDFTENITFSIFTDKILGDHFRLTFEAQELEKGVKFDAGGVMVFSYNISKAGLYNFSYAINTIDESTLVEVKKTSKAGEYFSGEIIAVNTTTENDKTQMPVIIYAIIRFGSYPVQNAQVSAVIQAPDGEINNLDLNDDGRGDPDITKNDGIYSRYFTNFTAKGIYTVRVSVSNIGSATRYGADKITGYTSCCGSELNNDTTPSLKPFTKVFETTFEAIGPRPDDGYKPSRITDLRIGEITDDGIVLTWTAPGEEADSGTASRYAIKLLCGEDNNADCNFNDIIEVVSKPPPLNYGKKQQLKLRIIDRTKTLFIRIIAFNAKNITSESNTVEIFRSSGTLPEVTTGEPVIKIAQVSKTGTIIGWVITGILIIICILGVIFHFRRKETHQPELYITEENKNDKKTKSTFEASDIPIKPASIKTIESFPVLLYTHDQIKEYKNKENDQPLYKSNVPPKQWKSLDILAYMEKKEDRDTKSLSSSSTVNLEGNNK